MSCYAANCGVFRAVTRVHPDCHVFSDSQNHASIVHGIGAARLPGHNDIEHPRARLRDCSRNAPKLMACESIYPMNGNMAPLEEYADLAKTYGAMLFVDEVHAAGCTGTMGRGSSTPRDSWGTWAYSRVHWGRPTDSWGGVHLHEGGRGMHPGV